MDTSPQAEQELSEVRKLAEELAVRRSVTHYAIGLAASMTGIVSFGVSMRLLVESVHQPLIFWPIALLAVASVVMSLRGFVLARRLQLVERERFKHYLELRARAGLD